MNSQNADFPNDRRDEVNISDEDNSDDESEFIHVETTRVIIGAFYALHNELGYGFLEAVYSNGLAVLLRNAGYRVDREAQFKIEFHGKIIGRYRADLIVDDKVVVEVKCARALDPMHSAQLLNYLRASGLEVGLVLNFGRSAEIKRVASSPQERRRVRASRIV
jgi:GxxExxY protein